MSLTPGFYKATVRGVPNQIVIVDQDGMGHHTGIPLDGVVTTHSHDGVVTDARPLIVLDLEDPGEFVRILRGVGLKGEQDTPSPRSYDHIVNGSISARRLGVIADQIEAQSRSPRIPEPLGHGALVTAGAKRQAGCARFLKIRGEGSTWVRLTTGDVYDWADLIDPELLREGVTS